MSDLKIKDAWVISYSFSQGYYSVEEFAEHVQKNAEAFLSDRPVDYVVMAYGSEAEARQACARLIELNRRPRGKE